MKILCIIPIFNEENRINNLLEKINSYKIDNKFKVDFLLINNGSKDNSLKIIKKHNLDFISIKRNKGIGYSLLLGLKIAHYNKYEILIHMAGNNKMSPFDIDNMLEPILKYDIDYVSGTRFRYKENYINNPLFRKISIKVLSNFFSILFKKKITDATCGFRAFKINKVYEYFSYFNKKNLYTYGYEYYSLGKVLLSKKLKFSEASVKMDYPKIGNYSKIKPIIDWIPIISGYIKARYDNKKIF